MLAWSVFLLICSGCARSQQGPDPASFLAEADLPADVLSEVEAPVIDGARLAYPSEADEKHLTAHFGPPEVFPERDGRGVEYGYASSWKGGGLQVQRRSAGGPAYKVWVRRRWSVDVAGARVGDRLSVVKQKVKVTHAPQVTTNGYKVEGHDNWLLVIDPPSGVGYYDGPDSRQRKEPHPSDPLITAIYYRNEERAPRLEWHRR